MNIVIDLTLITEFFSLRPDLLMWKTFIWFGWLPIVLAFLLGSMQAWVYYRKVKWKHQQTFILLAIDVPRGNEQTARAVENMFAYLGGAHKTWSLVEEYWEGKFQLSFSLEVVSIEGYTQFLIHTPFQFRDLVETAVYSQYPDAEIVEVDDYTDGTPDKFPDEEYDIYGGEFIQDNNPMYPIKTYEEFEHQLGRPEEQYKDPMATLMDLCSSLRKGEQLWFQILIIPFGFDWPEHGQREISRILKEKDVNITLGNKAVDWVVKIMGDISEVIYKLWGDIDEKKKDEKDDSLKMMQLKPGEKKKVEGIQNKIDKLGFQFKSRFVYLARKEVKNVPKVFGGFVGYMKQFMDLGLNSLKPDMNMTVTTVDYLMQNFRLNIRKNKLMNAYKGRSTTKGRRKGLMNIEELATIWHFPTEAVVKAPLIQKAPGRKATAPMELPLGEEVVSESILQPIMDDNVQTKTELDKDMEMDIKQIKKAKTKSAPPANLPFA